MEKYLKMSDFVVGKVQLACNRNFDVCVSYDCVDPDMIVRKTMDAMEHAINSHDELVAMNKELLAALESLDDCYSDTSREYLSRSELLHHKAVRADVHAIIDKAKATS